MITKVFVLYTGGTIGMAPKDVNDPYSPLGPQPLADLLGYIPGCESGNASDRNQAEVPTKYRSQEARDLWLAGEYFLELDNGNVIQFGLDGLTPVDSSSITPDDWVAMANKIQAVYSDYDGFVILHGTDTMAFTSSALSFIFENLAKPVVITGSQLPISQTRTDAVQNFINAMYVAGYKATDLPLIPEVVIVFADRIVRGCRASKVSAADWQGFNSPNYPLLGTIGEHIVVSTNYVLPAPASSKKLFVKADLKDQSVFNINLFPGFTSKSALIEKLFLDDAVAGVVMRTYGAGNAPDDPNFLGTVRRSIANGKLIVNITQCSVGTVEMGLYEASSELLEAGVLSGLDMTPEAALTKLMWTLATQYGEGRTSQMQISQRGEQTENLFDLRFGEVKTDEAKSSFTHAVSPDGRLDRDRISRAMLRISKLGFRGALQGDAIQVRAFMNMPLATHDTPAGEERCVGTFDFTYDEASPVQTRMKNITYKTQNVIGNGEVILTLVADKAVAGSDERVPVDMFFDGLYIAVYAKA